jgi:prepilin peptidase dependent protein B
MLGPVTARHQRGGSLVELMLGLALGLFIVGAAGTLLVHRLREHRALLIETRLMHDLRSSADLIARDLRRAGYWGDATAAMRRPGSTTATNPYAAIMPAAAASDAVSFSFSRDASENNRLDDNEHFGFRLRGGAIDMLLGRGNWQAVTDPDSMRVTAFEITLRTQELSLEAGCDRPCAPGAAGCAPRQQVRHASVDISARSVADGRIERSIRSEVRVRNDAVVGVCPA